MREAKATVQFPQDYGATCTKSASQEMERSLSEEVESPVLDADCDEREVRRSCKLKLSFEPSQGAETTDGSRSGNTKKLSRCGINRTE